MKKVFEDKFPLDDFPPHKPTNRGEKVRSVTLEKMDSIDVPEGHSISWSFDAESGVLEMFVQENEETELG